MKIVKYIDKDALVAKIRNKVDSYRGDGIISIGVLKQHCEDFISSLDTLKVREVDLEKEIDTWYQNKAPKEFEDVLYEDIEKFAKYFFELGVQVSNKAQKGE